MVMTIRPWRGSSWAPHYLGMYRICKESICRVSLIQLFTHLSIMKISSISFSIERTFDFCENLEICATCSLRWEVQTKVLAITSLHLTHPQRIGSRNLQQVNRVPIYWVCSETYRSVQCM